jgi:acyl carrier protein
MRCFAAVFPSLSEEHIGQIGAQDFESWDSIDLVSLFAVVEEEFGIDSEELVDEVDSFESMVKSIQARL